jgi:hypothetical protein
VTRPDVGSIGRCPPRREPRAERDGDEGLGEWVNVGVFEAVVCARCGFTELYIDAPEKIPVDGRVVTLLEASDRGPYR